MSKQQRPRRFSYPDQKRQTRNRHSSAGITAREATRLFTYMDKIRDIASKNNLYVGYESKLLQAAQIIEELLIDADRL